MLTDRRLGKMSNSQPTRFSVQRTIDDVRRQAVSFVTRAPAIAEGLQSLDAALQIFSEDRSAAEMQAVVDAARNLSELLEADDQPSTIESDLQTERVLKLRHAKAYFENRELPSLMAIGGDVPW